MRIKSFRIMRYGPLCYEKEVRLKNFNLLWGRNEQGKTLTIDALVKMLLGTASKVFPGVSRVDEEPEGYVILEVDEGKEVKLPAKGSLTKFTGLSTSECSNIFIVRNSDLSIARDVEEEGKFYISITDRLTGLKTEQISKVKNALREIGRITPSGDFKNVGDEKLKTRIAKAQSVLKQIGDLQETIKQESTEQTEKDIAQIRDSIQQIGEELSKLDDARRRQKYEEGEKALGNLKKCQERLKDLQVYNEDDEKEWRDCERDIKRFEQEKKDIRCDLKNKERKLEQASKDLKQLESRFLSLKNIKEKIDEEIRPELKNYEKRLEDINQLQAKVQSYSWFGKIALVLLILCLVASMFNRSRLISGVGLGSLFLIAYWWIGKLRLAKAQGSAKATLDKINLILSRFKLNGKTVEEIFSNLQKFEEEYNRRDSDLDEEKRYNKSLDETIKNLREEKIPKIEKTIEELRGKIEVIKSKSKEHSLDGYSKKLKEKHELQKKIEGEQRALESLFDRTKGSLEENMSYWEKEINKLKEYKDKAKGVTYSEEHEKQLKEKSEEMGEQLEELQRRLSSVRKDMEEIAREATEILRPGEPLYCQTSTDLEAIKEKLREFVQEKTKLKEITLNAITIFEEIEAEEKAKVSELFGKESPVSEFFKTITDGLYEEVIFNNETNSIEVLSRDGLRLSAEWLSGGAYDQLYFSIRLALGQKLLKGKKGFFILDDPFVKADFDRLKKQIEVLKAISESGWQIIYFSAKNELKEALQADIKKGRVNYIEVPGILLR